MNAGALYLAVQICNIEEIKRLLSESDFDVNAVLDRRCETPLYFAIKSGNYDTVKAFIEHSSMAKAVTSELFQKLLKVSINHRYCEIFKLLMQNVPRILELFVDGDSLEDFSIRCVLKCESSSLTNEEKLILQLLDESNVDIEWGSCLVSATAKENIEYLDYILQNERFEASSTYINGGDFLEMFSHACKYNNASLCDKLLSHPKLDQISTGIKESNLWPLPIVMLKPDVEQVLLKHGLFRYGVPFSDSYLHVACIMGHITIVQEALRSLTVTENPRILRCLLAATYNRQLDIVKLFFDWNKLTDSVRMYWVEECLKIAIRYGDKSVMKFLVSFWPRSVKIQSKINLLHFAIKFKNIENVEYLLELGADILHVDSDRGTVLHQAAALTKNSLEISKLLREHGALLNVLDVNGHTPLSLACSRGDLQLVKYLLDQGADACIDNFNLFGYNSALLSAFQHLDSGPDYNSAEQVEIMQLIIDHSKDSERFPFELSHVMMDCFTTKKDQSDMYNDVYNYDQDDIIQWLQFEMPLVQCLFDNMPDESFCEISNMCCVLKYLKFLDCESGWTSLDYKNFIDLLFGKAVEFGVESQLMRINMYECPEILATSWNLNPYLGKYVCKKLCGMLDADIYSDLDVDIFISACMDNIYHRAEMLSVLKDCGFVNQVNEVVSKNPELGTYVIKDEPLSLQSLARISIRRQMYQNSGNIEGNIKLLSLPFTLKEYLSFNQSL